MSDTVVSRRAQFGYRWTLRGVDPRVVRRMKIEAIFLGVPLAQLVNVALEEWLIKYTAPALPEQGTIYPEHRVSR